MEPASVMLRMHGSTHPRVSCVECAIPALRVEVLRGCVLAITSEPAPDWDAMLESDPPEPRDVDLTEQIAAATLGRRVDAHLADDLTPTDEPVGERRADLPSDRDPNEESL